MEDKHEFHRNANVNNPIYLFLLKTSIESLILKQGTCGHVMAMSKYNWRRENTKFTRYDIQVKQSFHSIKCHDLLLKTKLFCCKQRFN